MVCGIAWLAVGFLVYLVARPRTVAAFPALTPDPIVLLPNQLRWLLGPVPTFVHVLAFSMMSASLVGATRRIRLFLCGAWAAVEIGFEAAQHPAFRQWLPQHSAAMSPISYVQSYLVAGTFDSSDILAAILGAACAALLLTPRKRRSP